MAAIATETVKVEKLVKEFLAAQSLKILPQEAFGDAVGQFVEKDDKWALSQFVEENLKLQVQGILNMEQDSDDDIEPVMEQIRQQQEEAFASGVRKRPRRRGKLKPRPVNWDSDDGPGSWEDQPGAFEYEDEDDDGTGTVAADDDASVKTTKKAPPKKAAAKKAPAKPRAPAKTKAPAKTPARGRKKVVDPELSDDEDEDDDVVMFDDPPPAPKSQPKRAAAAKPRQTQLNFSQAAKTQVSVELSDDEISDEDAFEPMPASRRR
jgi:double-strand break repair protein MRE11